MSKSLFSNIHYQLLTNIIPDTSLWMYAEKEYINGLGKQQVHFKLELCQMWYLIKTIKINFSSFHLLKPKWNNQNCSNSLKIFLCKISIWSQEMPLKSLLPYWQMLPIFTSGSVTFKHPPVDFFVTAPCLYSFLAHPEADFPNLVSTDSPKE